MEGGIARASKPAWIYLRVYSNFLPHMWEGRLAGAVDCCGLRSWMVAYVGLQSALGFLLGQLTYFKVPNQKWDD